MTSSNINKIVRSNITLKPWILSKNTSEIVNTCIQKIYRQSQNSFKNDQSKIAAPKPENKGPIRALKSQERDRVPLSINVSRAKKAAAPGTTRSVAVGMPGAGTGAGVGVSGAIGVNGSPNNERNGNHIMTSKKSAVANLTAHRKLLKSSPNYKIYSSRRFGSSASSSNASIFRRGDERRRTSNQTAHLNYLLRSFGTQISARGPSNYGLHSGVAKYLVSARNQHMESRTVDDITPNMVQMTSTLQRDLMPVNSAIKDRIALGRSRLSKLAAHKLRDNDPMSGWHHPPSPELFLSRFNERGIANAELQEQYRRMKTANKLRQFEQLRQMEKRTSILGTVGKKTMRQRVLGDFDGITKETTPRNSPHLVSRSQSQTLERMYSARISRQQQAAAAAAAVAELEQTAPKQSTDLITSAVAITATPGATQQVATSTQLALPPPMEEQSCVIDSPTPLANAAVVSPMTSLAVTSQVAPPPMEETVYAPRISKHSATSVVVKGQATYNNVRFNRSSYLRRF